MTTPKDQEECRVCHDPFTNRPDCDPTDICDLCAQTELAEMRTFLMTASHALRSYQFGNSSPDLAQEIADKIDARLRTQTADKLEGK